MAFRRWPAHLHDWPGRLKLSLAEHEWLARDLAEPAGVSLQQIHFILAGRQQGSPQVQGALADALDEDPGWLFPRTDIEVIRAEMFRLSKSPTYSGITPRHRGLEVAHSYQGECRDTAGL